MVCSCFSPDSRPTNTHRHSKAQTAHHEVDSPGRAAVGGGWVSEHQDGLCGRSQALASCCKGACQGDHHHIAVARAVCCHKAAPRSRVVAAQGVSSQTGFCRAGRGIRQRLRAAHQAVAQPDRETSDSLVLGSIAGMPHQNNALSRS